MNTLYIPPRKTTTCLYTSLQNSHAISDTDVATTLFDENFKSGIFIGANTLQIGDVININFGGYITTNANKLTLTTELGGVLLSNCDIPTGHTIDTPYTCQITLVVRNIGTVEQACIVSNGIFSYYVNDTMFQEGLVFNKLENTYLDTTIDNLLDVRAQWDTIDPTINIFTTIVNITKTSL